MPVTEAPLVWELTDLRRRPDVVAVICRRDRVWIRGMSFSRPEAAGMSPVDVPPPVMLVPLILGGIATPGVTIEDVNPDLAALVPTGALDPADGTLNAPPGPPVFASNPYQDKAGLWYALPAVALLASTAAGVTGAALVMLTPPATAVGTAVVIGGAASVLLAGSVTHLVTVLMHNAEVEIGQQEMWGALMTDILGAVEQAKDKAMAGSGQTGTGGGSASPKHGGGNGHSGGGSSGGATGPSSLPDWKSDKPDKPDGPDVGFDGAGKDGTIRTPPVTGGGGEKNPSGDDAGPVDTQGSKGSGTTPTKEPVGQPDPPEGKADDGNKEPPPEHPQEDAGTTPNPMAEQGHIDAAEGAQMVRGAAEALLAMLPGGSSPDADPNHPDESAGQFSGPLVLHDDGVTDPLEGEGGTFFLSQEASAAIRVQIIGERPVVSDGPDPEGQSSTGAPDPADPTNAPEQGPVEAPVSWDRMVEVSGPWTAAVSVRSNDDWVVSTAVPVRGTV